MTEKFTDRKTSGRTGNSSVRVDDSSVRVDNRGRPLADGEDQLKTGRYRYRYKEGGKRRAVYSWRLEESDPGNDKSLREKEKELSGGTLIAPAVTATVTVRELIERYLGLKVTIANSTMENYWFLCRKHVWEHPLASKEIRAVRRSDVLSFYTDLYRKGLSVGTIQIYQNLLFPAFAVAVDDDLIQKNPCANCMKLFSQRKVVSSRTALSAKEEEALLGFVKGSETWRRYYLLILLLLRTGVRISEALGLTWKDIDFKKGTVKIDHQLLYRKKNGKFEQYVSVPKNKKFRVVPLTQDLLGALRQAEKLGEHSDETVEGLTDFLFLNSLGRVTKPNVVTRAFHSIREDYNVVEETLAKEEGREAVLLPTFTAHTFRHTFCTRMAEKGMDVKVLQTLMGHSNVTVTMEVYNHVREKRVLDEFYRVNS